MDIFHWLCLDNPLPAICDLDLDIALALELSAVGHFVQALGDGLHNLAIPIRELSPRGIVSTGESPFPLSVLTD